MKDEPEVSCMAVTPFKANGDIDEDGYRAHLTRMAASGCAVYFASPGSGEGHSLSPDELARIYRIGVETCKGKVTTRANLCEARNVDALLRSAKIAKDAGVDVIQIYTVDAGHGMLPNEKEQEAFYRTALEAIDHPVGLSVNILAGGYITPVGVLKRLCADYKHVVSMNVLQPPTNYLAELMDAVGPRIPFYTGIEMLAESLMLGAQGCLASQPNVIPYHVRSIGKHFVTGRLDDCGEALKQIFRINVAIARFARAHDTPQFYLRWIKPAMKFLGLPGHGDGRMRAPYIAYAPDEMAELEDVLSGLDLAGLERRAMEVR